ncbi:hypothetical protein N7493_008053 [Penicillium malachiteum]|uniref:Uncharacterized protein n=1 Tax=Penicillium malachiteum TaxID=1324776 RepID=A0AAD6MTH8_9EURO|nr:hypothetical protein N7493_008053 [Penicillium malachiteum]
MSFFDRQGIPDYLIQPSRKAKSSVWSLSANSMNERLYVEESESEYDTKKSFEDDVSMLKDYSLISISADGASL